MFYDEQQKQLQFVWNEFGPLTDIKSLSNKKSEKFLSLKVQI